MANTLVHVDEFVSQITRYYPEITFVQTEGFRSFIEVNRAHYQKSMDGFIPFLEEYLGESITK